MMVNIILLVAVAVLASGAGAGAAAVTQCPTTSNAQSCFLGMTGPPGAVAFFQATQRGAGITVSPPVSTAVTRGSDVCVAYVQPCPAGISLNGETENGTSVTLTNAQCPAGSAIHFYSATSLGQNCNSLVTSFSAPTSAFTNLTLCTSNGCNYVDPAGPAPSASGAGGPAAGRAAAWAAAAGAVLAAAAAGAW